MVTTENGANQEVKKQAGHGENIETMEQAMASMDAMKADGKSAVIERGNVVVGTIIKITSDNVYVDVGHKSEGIIQITEFTELDEKPEIGSTVRVMVLKPEDKNGDLILSKKKADIKLAWDEIMNNMTAVKPIKARIVRTIKGGYEASFKGVRCFVPSSQLAERKDVKPADFIGNSYDFKIIDVQRKRGNVVLSRKALVDEVEKERLDKIFSSIQEGGTIKGTVKSITEYGAFVDIGGIDGLLHITDMSYGHVSNPADIVSIGSELTCKILKLDRTTKKISLGIKQLSKNPWEEVPTKYAVGELYDGTVKNTTDYGVFVTLEPGVDGLVHISDLSWSGRAKPSDFKVGEPLKIRVLDINLEDRKIKFGVKQVTDDPWKKVVETYTENTITTGKVKSLVSYGAFIELEDGIEGFVHISNISWTKKINHPSESLKLGQVIEVKVLKIDNDAKKISLGIKQTHPDPWTLVEEKFAVGQVVTGEVTNVKKFGAFVELEDGIEGLIHVSDLSWTKHLNHANEVIKSGEKVTVKILEINSAEKKIALGYKHMQKDPWQEIDAKYPVGTEIEGKITHFTKFGAFIEVEEGIEGLLHTSDLSWTKKYSDPSELLKEGEAIKVKVLNIDRDQRKISLGLKQLAVDPLVHYKEKMDNNETLDGKIKSIQEYGAFVEFDDGLEGLVHISQLAEDRVDKVENVVKVGQHVRVKIIEVNLPERKIKLTMREDGGHKVSLEHVNDEKEANFSLKEKLQDALAAKQGENNQ